MKQILLKTSGLLFLLKRRRQSSTAEVFEAGCWCQFRNPSWNAKGERVKFSFVVCVRF